MNLKIFTVILGFVKTCFECLPLFYFLTLQVPDFKELNPLDDDYQPPELPSEDETAPTSAPVFKVVSAPKRRIEFPSSSYEGASDAMPFESPSATPSAPKKANVVDDDQSNAIPPPLKKSETQKVTTTSSYVITGTSTSNTITTSSIVNEDDDDDDELPDFIPDFKPKSRIASSLKSKLVTSASLPSTSQSGDNANKAPTMTAAERARKLLRDSCPFLDDDKEEVTNSTQSQPVNSQPTSGDTSQEEELLLCTICQEIFHEPVNANPCNHMFCAGCISMWLTRSRDCPQCRQPVTECREIHLIKEMVERYLQKNPNRRRSQEELEELNKANTITRNKPVVDHQLGRGGGRGGRRGRGRGNSYL